MRPVAAVGPVVISCAALVVGCASGKRQAAPTTAATTSVAATTKADAPPPGPAQRILGLPPVRRGALPGYLLVADRNNNRAIILSPSKRVVWVAGGLRGPDDAFFTPGYRSIITNEEFNDTLTEVSLRTKARIWRYGHDAVPGSSPGYLDSPDDAYRLANGATTIADIKNCRIVTLSRARRVERILGGSCVHDPPRGFASPNGDTPLPDGGLLVTEIGPPGWIDRLDARGNLVWAIPSPVTYPSDAQLLPNGRILVSGFTDPGRIVELTRSGHVTWSFGTSSGPDHLAKPSLAVLLPNGLIASNDDWNHRVILIDPKTKRIVWQYGHTGVAGSGPGYLSKPDGLDLLPSSFTSSKRTQALPASSSHRASRAATTKLVVRRIGSLPAAGSRIAAVALPDGRVVALGGLVGGTSSRQVLVGRPEALRLVGSLPVATHDDAAVLSGRSVYLYGGGEAVSSPAVVRVDLASGRARTVGRMSEPLSDLGAATVGGRNYLVGGYTGSKYATAVLRARGVRISVVARLPQGLRYAGVASLGDTIYVAGGVATSGDTRAVEAVDPRSGSVTRLGSLPRPLAHAALVAVGNALFAVGGEVGGRPTAQILRIDPSSGVSRVVGRLPRPLADPAAVVAGGRVIVLGGAGSSASNAVYAFTP